VLTATVVLSLILTFLTSLGLMITQRPAADYLDPYLCEKGTELITDSHDYSYKPGQRGTAVGFRCCDCMSSGTSGQWDGRAKRRFEIAC